MFVHDYILYTVKIAKLLDICRHSYPLSLLLTVLIKHLEMILQINRTFLRYPLAKCLYDLTVRNYRKPTTTFFTSDIY